MASAPLRDELTCSICLSIYTDPVTLTCGHSFCRRCLNKAWDSMERKELSCPECRQTFRKRPKLHGNRRMRNIAESFRSAEPAQVEVGLSCTYCIHSRVPAAKTCLLCEASLCEKHLKVHSKSPEHVLTQPTATPGNWKCPVHRRVLEYYCSKDSVFICVSCRLDGEHAGHPVETLTEVSEKKKEKLKGVLEKLGSKSEAIEESVRGLRDTKEKLLKKVNCEKERLDQLVRDIKERMEALQTEVLSQISMQEKQLWLQISDLIRQMEARKEKLSMRTRDIEELRSMADPLTVILGCESDGADAWNSETEDDENTKGEALKFQGLHHRDVGLASATLHRGLRGVSNAIEKWGEVLEASDFFLYGSDDSDGPQTPSRGKASPGAFLEGYSAADVTLDVNTASNDVIVSDDLKTVLWTARPQGRPESPVRFEPSTPQVLSTASFSSGRHCWEVETLKTAYIRVGVAYPSIDRAGLESLIGANPVSWALQRFDNQYVAMHCNSGVLVPYAPSCQRLGIFLDYEAGRLSFYELRDPIRHLHTFTATFTEPLHAAFWVLEASVTIRSSA